MRPVYDLGEQLAAPVAAALGVVDLPVPILLLDGSLPDAAERLDRRLAESRGVLVLSPPDRVAEWLQRGATEVVPWPCPPEVLRARVERVARLQRLPFLERLFELADDAVEITRQDATLLDVNPAFVRNTGYAYVDAIGQTPAALFRSKFHDPLFYEQIPAAHERGEAWRGGLTARRGDGSFAQQEVVIAEVSDPAGRVVGHLSVKRDMERDELANRAQASAESRMQALLDQLSEGVIVHDLTGVILDANPAAQRMLGRPGASLQGSSMLDVEQSDDAEALTRSWQALGASEPLRTETTWTRGDGTVFPVEINRGRTTVDGAHVVLTVARDFTRRVEARRRLEELNERLTVLTGSLEELVHERTAELQQILAQRGAILDNLVDGLAAVDRDGRIQANNPELARILEVDYVDHRGKLLSEVDPRLSDLAEVAIERGRVQVEEIALPSNRIGLITASPILVDGEAVRCRGSVVLLRDVTLQREIDRMKTDFIATVSHELRTPLTSVLGFAKLVREKFKIVVQPVIPVGDRKVDRASAQIERNLDIIAGEGQRLASLINDVLDISKMEAGRVDWREEPVLVRELVTRAIDVTSSLFTSEAVVVTQDVAPGLPTVMGDTERLLQVLINLLSNAQKFTEAGEVAIRVRANTHELVFSVTDTGAGIASEDQARVFEKFRQAGDTLTSKPRGTGLGLPICRQIVDHHRGRLWVDSELGSGSCFSFTIPLGAEVPQRTPEVEFAERVLARVHELAAVNGEPASFEILVVDDAVELRILLRQILEEAGYSVREAENGLVALQKIRERAPDLVVLDVMMPDITGFDVAASLRADPATKDLPIVILSIVADQARGLQLGVDRYLTKPLDDELLLGTIQDLLSRDQVRRRVLLVAADPEVASPVMEGLRSRGETVTTTSSPEEALRLAREASPDVVMVMPPPGDGGAWIRLLRADPVLEASWVLLVGD